MFSIKKQKNNIANTQIIKNNSGIALILTIIILTNLLMITLIITDVILRIGKSSQQISESEVAYLAAESANEQAIYQIAKNKDASALGIVSAVTADNLVDVDANWERYVEPIYTIIVTCVADDGKITYYPNVDTAQELLSQIVPLVSNGSGCIYAENYSGNISANNSLAVMLPPNKSFELDLDINSPSGLSPSFYPDKIKINWGIYPFGSTQPDGSIIILDNSEQTVYHTQSVNPNWLFVPVTGNFGNSPNYRLRIINEDTNIVVYLLTPSAQNQYLPVGLRIISNGYYAATKRKERTVEIEKKFWQIY